MAVGARVSASAVSKASLECVCCGSEQGARGSAGLTAAGRVPQACGQGVEGGLGRVHSLHPLRSDARRAGTATEG